MLKLDLQLFATNTMGTKLQIGANSIAELHDIGGMNLTADTIETTTLDSTSNFRTFIQKLKDGGDVTASGFFNPGDTNGQAALYAAYGTGAVTAFTILFPSTLGASWTFNAIVVEVKTGAKVGDAIPWDIKLKVTGVPSLLVTPSAAITTLAMTGTGGTLSPASSGTVYSYTFNGVTVASVTITITAAAQTIKLYLDGVYSQDLISGSPSSAIPLTINVGKKLTIVANEAGKTQNVYDVIAVKTA